MASAIASLMGMSTPLCRPAQQQQYCPQKHSLQAVHVVGAQRCYGRRASNAPSQPSRSPVQRLQPLAVSYAEPAADKAAPAGVLAGWSDPHNQLAAPMPWTQAGQGLVHFTDGSSSFRVWAPHAQAITLQVCTHRERGLGPAAGGGTKATMQHIDSKTYWIN